MTEAAETIRELLVETAEAHHQAYADSNGVDPEWPLWYADYLHDRLLSLLEAEMTKSELVYLLLLFEKQRVLEAPGAAWATYYARQLVTRYGLIAYEREQ